MIDSSDRNHSLLWKVARAGAAAACGLAGIGVVLAFLPAFGLRFQGLSDTWQSLVVIGAVGFLCGCLSWPTVIPERSRAGQYPSSPITVLPIIKYAAHVAVILLLLLLWLGIRPWPETKKEQRTVTLVRVDRSFAPPDPTKPQTFLSNESIRGAGLDHL